MTGAPLPPIPPPATQEPKMEKRVRDWRSILTELVIVMAGVGLALAAQQAADWLRWRSEVTQAREVIATELASNLAGAATRLRTQPCTERRLDQLALILDAAAKDGSLPAVGYIRRPPRGIWPSGAWESVVASQTATHFPRQQLADIAAAYKVVERIEDLSATEIADWNELYTMVGPGRRLDPPSEAGLRKALSEGRSAGRTMAGLGLQLANRVKTLHLPFSHDDLDRIASSKRPAVSSAPADICLPIGPVTASYGQAANALGVPLGPDADNPVNLFPEFTGAAR